MNKPTRYFSKKQETKVAKKLGMRTQPNSGATKFAKGDVADEHLLIECKTTTKPQKTFTIHKEWLTETKNEQYAMGKDLSAVVVNFGDGEDYYILDSSDFKNLYETWRREIDGDMGE